MSDTLLKLIVVLIFLVFLSGVFMAGRHSVHMDFKQLQKEHEQEILNIHSQAYEAWRKHCGCWTADEFVDALRR